MFKLITNQKLWLVLLNLFLLVPVLFTLGVTKGFIGVNDLVILWNVACSVLFLLSFQLLFRKPVVFHILIFPLYLAVCIDYFIIQAYGARFSAGYIWLIFANLNDWQGYAQTFKQELIAGGISFLAFYSIGLWYIRKISLSFSGKFKWMPLAALVLLYFGVAVRQEIKHQHASFSIALAEVLALDASSPAGIISQGIIVYDSLQEHEVSEERKAFVFNATRQATDEAEVYVMVVGESARADRFSLGGYERETNPLLKKTDNVIYYNSIAACPLTLMSVPVMLTRGTMKTFDKTRTERSVSSAFKEVGFKTYWYSTQVFGNSSGAIHLLFSDADDVRFYKRDMDGVLLEGIDEILDGVKSRGEKAFIILHTEGSHMNYVNRYPEEFRKFPDSTELDRKQQMGNAYDNSILYTDYILSEIIDRLDNKDIISTLLFASDHGENLLDDKKGLLGHSYGNYYDMSVPFIFWYSDEYSARYPEKVKGAYSNVLKQLSADNIFYSLVDIADISFDGFEAEMSFLNSSLVGTKWSDEFEKERKMLCSPAGVMLRQY